MKRTLLATLLIAAAPIAFAQESSCLPGSGDCAEPALAAPAPALPAMNLCDHQGVREAVRIEQDLRPVKRLYDIAMNPTGFVIEKVSEEAGVKIPKWVGYAMDPRGAVRNEVMKRVRAEVKKNVGLANDCAVAPAIDDESDGPFPTPEADTVEA
ncbi:hypothetical protein BWI17_05925 [Betaproteobacteria bacterium GR16-43]|nr:hypothetical protein BWI17_05925 [Betaproteobacteria bacterium GR16-43]